MNKYFVAFTFSIFQDIKRIEGFQSFIYSTNDICDDDLIKAMEYLIKEKYSPEIVHELKINFDFKIVSLNKL